MAKNSRHAIYITSHVPMADGLGCEKRAWQHLQGLKINQRKVSVILLDWGQRLPANNLKYLIDQTSGLLRLNCNNPDQYHLFDLAVSILKSIFKARFRHHVDRTSTDQLNHLIERIDPDLVFCFKREAGLVWQQLLKQSNAKSRQLIIDLDTLAQRPSLNELKVIAQHDNVIAAINHYCVSHLWQHDEMLLFHTNKNIIVSALHDANKLAMTRRATIIDVIPQAVAIQPKNKQRHSLIRILFAANLHNYVNCHAIKNFCYHIWPRIQKVIKNPCQVDIVGHHAQALSEELAHLSGVCVWQDTRQLSELYHQATLAIYPILFNHGSKTTMLEAMSYAIPVVTTSAGIEGFDVTPGQDLLVGDSAEQFANHCIRLITDENTNITIGENGHYLVKQRYSNYSVQQQLANLVSSMQR